MKQSWKGYNVLNRNSIHVYAGLTALLFVFLNNSHSQELPPLTHSLTPVTKAVKAPELRFQNMDQEMVDIKDLRGKVVVVNFWATWCPPCRREMGSLERLYQATKDKNVEVLAINIGEDIDTVFSFLGMVEPTPNFQMLFDYDAVSMNKWDVKGLPTTYIIGPNGTIVYKAVGGREFDHPDIIQKVIQLGR
ncbi:MAG: TlpA family protein disulfide reductase [Gammaproteobacteria bacterium]|nr:TlpA family protein disulfide reductase [Gammaproteobacteria bacterium]